MNTTHRITGTANYNSIVATTMIRDEASMKNGMVSSVMIAALKPFERQPLASHSAKGKASTSSMAVTVKATRSVRTEPTPGFRAELLRKVGEFAVIDGDADKRCMRYARLALIAACAATLLSGSALAQGDASLSAPQGLKPFLLRADANVDEQAQDADEDEGRDAGEDGQPPCPRQ